MIGTWCHKIQERIQTTYFGFPYMYSMNSEFSDKKYLSLKGFEPEVSSVRDQEDTYQRQDLFYQLSDPLNSPNSLNFSFI